MYAAIYHDSDGYTYWCDVVLGVFNERSKADDFILREVESKQYGWRKLEDYEVREFEINIPWEQDRVRLVLGLQFLKLLAVVRFHDSMPEVSMYKCDICDKELTVTIPDDLRYRPKFCSIVCSRKSGMDLNGKGIPYCVHIETLGDISV